jgi:predicted class III extradiol MEMO1 family dioxygenase
MCALKQFQNDFAENHPSCDQFGVGVKELMVVSSDFFHYFRNDLAEKQNNSGVEFVLPKMVEVDLQQSCQTASSKQAVGCVCV